MLIIHAKTGTSYVGYFAVQPFLLAVLRIRASMPLRSRFAQSTNEVLYLYCNFRF